MKYYTDENLVNIGQHGSKPQNAEYVLPDNLVGRAYKLDGDTIVLDEVGEAARLAAKAQAEIEAAKEQEISDMQQRFHAAQRIKAKIALINQDKGWSSGEIIAYLNDPVIQSISQLLAEISFGTALSVLDASDLSAYYTQEEVDEVKAMIQAHLDSEA